MIWLLGENESVFSINSMLSYLSHVANQQPEALVRWLRLEFFDDEELGVLFDRIVSSKRADLEPLKQLVSRMLNHQTLGL